MAVIEVKGLKKRYHDGTYALQGVDFEVQRGEIFGLLGPNGAGKTTTMRILGTLHRATAGSARVLGLDVERDAGKVRRRIGFAMQEVGMDDLATAWEMLLFHGSLYRLSGRHRRHRAKELLEAFGLWEHRKRRVTRFSGGMQRRLDLAVSLLHEPEVLFLDEPTTGLDPHSRADLWQLLRRLRREQGLTILMSTHYMDEADALCDRIAIMADGRIRATDTPEHLKRTVSADALEVRLARPPDSRQMERLRSSFGRNLFVAGNDLRIRVKDGSRALLPAMRVLDGAGVDVEGTHVRTPTLDDVFLKYTGLRLQEAEA